MKQCIFLKGHSSFLLRFSFSSWWYKTAPCLHKRSACFSILLFFSSRRSLGLLGEGIATCWIDRVHSLLVFALWCVCSIAPSLLSIIKDLVVSMCQVLIFSWVHEREPTKVFFFVSILVPPSAIKNFLPLLFCEPSLWLNSFTLV